MRRKCTAVTKELFCLKRFGGFASKLYEGIGAAHNAKVIVELAIPWSQERTGPL